MSLDYEYIMSASKISGSPETFQHKVHIQLDAVRGKCDVSMERAFSNARLNDISSRIAFSNQQTSP